MSKTAEILNQRGLTEVGNGDLVAAAESFLGATKEDPGFAQAHNHLGAVMVQLGQIEQAIPVFERALELDPGRPESHQNLGYALERLGRDEEAVAALKRAVEIKDDYPDAWNNLGNVFSRLDRTDDAVGAYRKAIQLAPEYPLAYNGLGNELAKQGHGNDALRCFARAVQLSPQYRDAFNNAGLVLRQMGRLGEAVQSFGHAAELDPGFADAWANLGVAQADLRKTDEAIAAFARALEIDPENSTARAQWLFQLARNCDWDTIEAEKARIPKLGVEGRAVPPFSMLAFDDDPARHRIRSQRFAAIFTPSARQFPKPNARPKRLRIGYFSSDFHNHATMYLAAGLLEAHDKRQFEVHAYSYGAPTSDPMRERASLAVDNFVDVSELSAGEVAARARADRIDIAIDLKGYTEGNRFAIFAERAAPVQMSFLGYPGTSGAPFIDYLVADEVVTPPSERQGYSEALMLMPGCYQVNDDSRPIAEGWTREKAGLPQDSLVFCCFNNSYKIGQREFEIWSRILARIERSSLWLLIGSETARKNVRAQAQRRGINPDRIIFADHVPLPDHLGRQQLADLFVDTFNYTAHTTASDALWAGLPIVTKAGRSFSARVAASTLEAIGLPELITETAEDYEALILRLASNPSELAAVRSKLQLNRDKSGLFDSQRFAKTMEEGFERAFARYADGLDPQDILLA